MDIAAGELIVIAFVVINLVGLVAAADAALQSKDRWNRADAEPLVWVLLPLFTGIIGAVLYYWRIKPKLKADAEPRPS